ncbi:MAG: sugar nucleotide-binding protein, partial [bacterium]|nr:sugar nucleotide-binding protein [bacterium]
YSPADLGSPLNYYGKAKLAAENLLMGSGLDRAILRTSILYDVDRLKGKENFVTWVIKNLKKGSRIRIVNDQWGNPTLARNLAEVVWRVISGNHSGIYNAAGRESCDRFSFTNNIAETFDLDPGLIQQVTSAELNQKAKRPLKIGLDISDTERDMKIKMYNIIEGLTIFKNDYLSLHRVN